MLVTSSLVASVTPRLLLAASIALGAVRAEAQRPTTPPPPHGATDVGIAQPLGTGARVAAAHGRAGFRAAWKHAAGRAAVFGPHAMVASDAPLASQAGVEI